MKKKIMTAATAALLALACLCGCAYGKGSVSCRGLRLYGYSSIWFDIEYNKIGHGGYDGRKAEFSVKDGFEFELYLMGLDTFDGTVPMTDIDGVTAFLFLQHDEKFFVYEEKDNRYGLAPCLVGVSPEDGRGYYFEFPPTARFGFTDGERTEVNLTWEEFSFFYGDLPYSEVFPEDMCATTACYENQSGIPAAIGTVTLFYEDGTVTAVPEFYDAQEDVNS